MVKKILRILKEVDKVLPCVAGASVRSLASKPRFLMFSMFLYVFIDVLGRNSLSMSQVLNMFVFVREPQFWFGGSPCVTFEASVNLVLYFI